MTGKQYLWLSIISVFYLPFEVAKADIQWSSLTFAAVAMPIGRCKTIINHSCNKPYINYFKFSDLSFTFYLALF